MRRLLFIRPTAASIATLLFILGPSAAAFADAPIGFYAGAELGEASVAADNVAFSYGNFREHASAWKGIAGVRLPLGWAIEANYIDFGHPRASLGAVSADLHVKGAAAFGVLFLPVPVVDLYVKAGFARLQADVGAFDAGAGTCAVGNPNCARFSLSRNQTVIAVGAGVQLNVGAFALRGEYERYDQTAGNPALLSVGLVFKFL